jgi:hypothetical protein
MVKLFSSAFKGYLEMDKFLYISGCKINSMNPKIYYSRTDSYPLDTLCY